jgi:hypothetical protein
MLIEHPTPRIVCHKCGCVSDATGEVEAKQFGWLVDDARDPHAHICPACVAAAESVPTRAD